MRRYFFPKLGDILFLSLFIAILLFGPRTFNLDGDLGRHITIGNYILDKFTIPRTDVFSHTMYGQSLIPHEWLAQIAFALFHHGLSLAGAVLLTAILVATTFKLVFYESTKRASTPLSSFAVTLLAAAASSLHWLARPHVFTFLFFAVWILLLERVRTNKRTPIWLFGLTMLLWANTHGAFIAGFVSWTAYIVGDFLDSWTLGKWDPVRLRTWEYIGIVSFLVTFINPAGFNLWGTSFGFVGNRYLVGHTQEYLPPDFHNPGTWPFLLMIGLTVFVSATKKERQPYSQILLLTGWLVLGLYSARNIPLFAIAASPVLAEMVSSLLSGVKRWNRIEANILNVEQTLRSGAWISVSFLLAVMALSTPVMQTYNSFDGSVFPVGAVDWLDGHPQEGNLFNYFPWGGYLLYRQWPDSLVFIDGQTDFYGENLTRKYEQVITLDKNWEMVLERYEISWALLPKNAMLAEELTQRTGWEVIYEDNTAAIFTRDK